MVRWLDIAAEIAAIDLGALALAADRTPTDFGRHRFPDLMGEHESRLVLRPEVAGERQHALALDLVREDRDRHQVRPQRHLVEGKQRPGGNAKILSAGFAAPPRCPVRPATGIDRQATAVRAIGVTVVGGEPFAATFFLATIKAIGVEQVRLEDV